MHSEREFMHAKHGSRPKYAFGERIHARRTCLMPPFLRAERGGRMGVGGGLKKKTRMAAAQTFVAPLLRRVGDGR